MKYLFSLFISSLSLFCCAQIPPGSYYIADGSDQAASLEILEDQFVLMRMRGQELGGRGTPMKDMVVGMKCRYNNNAPIKWFDMILFDTLSGRELKTIPGIYEQTGEYTFRLSSNVNGDQRPEDFGSPYHQTYDLVEKSDRAYVAILLLNERVGIPDFTPDTSISWQGKNEYRITYNFEGKGINDSRFQTSELHSQIPDQRRTEVRYYDAKGRPFTNQSSYFKEVKEVDTTGRLVLQEYYVNETDLISYQKGGLLPQVKKIYEGDRLFQVKHFLNNPTLEQSIPVTFVHLYDAYGDEMGVDQYFANGDLREDSLQIILLNRIRDWIKDSALYPNSIELVQVGHPTTQWSGRNGQRSSENRYRISLEGYLKNRQGERVFFTHTYWLDSQYQVYAISLKKRPKRYNRLVMQRDTFNWQNVFGIKK